VILTLYEQEWRQYKTVCAHALDRSCPFSIPRLNLLWLASSISTRDNHITTDNTHHKAGLVKVVEVGIIDTVFRSHIRY